VDNFFNIIYRVLIKFNQNPSKKQNFKEHKLLTIRLLLLIKNQLNIRQNYPLKPLISMVKY
jgi:hypothetical protein